MPRSRTRTSRSEQYAYGKLIDVLNTGSVYMTMLPPSATWTTPPDHEKNGRYAGGTTTLSKLPAAQDSRPDSSPTSWFDYTPVAVIAAVALLLFYAFTRETGNSSLAIK